MEQRDRSLLIEQMVKAKTVHELDAAEKAADGWLDEYPNDLQVVLVRERLDESSSKLQDPRRTVNKLSLAACAIVFVFAGLLCYALTTHVSLSAVVGLIAGIDVACWIRDAGGWISSTTNADI